MKFIRNGNFFMIPVKQKTQIVREDSEGLKYAILTDEIKYKFTLKEAWFDFKEDVRTSEKEFIDLEGKLEHFSIKAI